jgi:hydrogenase maturation protease
MNKTLIIGIGNRYRRDDGLGPTAAQRLAQLNLPNIDVLESEGDLTSLADEIKKCDLLVLIDSALGGKSPGSIHKINPFDREGEVLWEKRFSTHGMGIMRSLELLNETCGLPEKTVIYGVEGADFSFGEGLSGPVINAVNSLVDCIKNELQE